MRHFRLSLKADWQISWCSNCETCQFESELMQLYSAPNHSGFLPFLSVSDALSTCATVHSFAQFLWCILPCSSPRRARPEGSFVHARKMEGLKRAGDGGPAPASRHKARKWDSAFSVQFRAAFWLVVMRWGHFLLRLPEWLTDDIGKGAKMMFIAIICWYPA